jgi:hypothetical protein
VRTVVGQLTPDRILAWLGKRHWAVVRLLLGEKQLDNPAPTSDKPRELLETDWDPQIAVSHAKSRGREPNWDARTLDTATNSNHSR